MARSDKPFEVTGGGGGALTNKQAADMIRKLTRTVQGRKINPSLMRERPGGATAPRTVPKRTGLSKSEQAQVSIKRPVTTRTGTPAKRPVGPISGKPLKPTTINPKTNTDTSSTTLGSRSPGAVKAARVARDKADKIARREALEARVSAIKQRNASIRTGGQVQNPRAEPVTRKVVEQQVKAGETVKRQGSGPNIKEGQYKGNLKAVVANRNRIESNARAARKPKPPVTNHQPRVRGGSGTGGTRAGGSGGGMNWQTK
mgnify:CR=1 FL=1